MHTHFLADCGSASLVDFVNLLYILLLLVLFFRPNFDRTPVFTDDNARYV